jgi:hypothetical protein
MAVHSAIKPSFLRACAETELPVLFQFTNGRPKMFSHIMIGANDVKVMVAFYDVVLEPLGSVRDLRQTADSPGASSGSGVANDGPNLRYDVRSMADWQPSERVYKSALQLHRESMFGQRGKLRFGMEVRMREARYSTSIQ